MNIHAIKTGSVAVRRRQRAGRGWGRTRLVSTMLDRTWVGPLPIYAWVIEHPEGLILVDTGETCLALEPGYFPGWHPYFRLAVREYVERGEEIDRKLESRGLPVADVRWVIMTHLHTDHAGGLHHFPHSEILVTGAELTAAAGRAGRLRGYVNRRFPSWFDPRPIELERSPAGPFAESFPVTRDGRVRIVPTRGHTPGHASVIVEGDHETLFIAGDASYTQELMLAGIVDGVAPDPRAARASLANVRAFCLEAEAIYLPSHDPASGRRLRDRLTVSEPGREPVGSGLASEQLTPRAQPAPLGTSGTPAFDRKT